jgi:uncharacterized protein (DUF427 family)
VALPQHAAILSGKVALAWRAMDGFYEEDERILGHAADPYHRIDIRHTSRHLVVRAGDRVVAETARPLVLYESGFAPRWYVPRDDVLADALTLAELQTFCPYKGIASYYDIDDAKHAAWSYRAPLDDMAAIGDLVSFEPDRVEITLDDQRLQLVPGQNVVAHGVDRNLSIGEAGALTAVPEGASYRATGACCRYMPVRLGWDTTAGHETPGLRPIQASRPSSLEVLLSAESTTLAESVPFPTEACFAAEARLGSSA